MSATEDEIRNILDEHGRLLAPISSIDTRGDLYAAGLTSHACVNVMLALEDAFDVEFPDAMLRKSTFESVAAIQDALAQLGASQPIAG
jgi:acyl carrier protein